MNTCEKCKFLKRDCEEEKQKTLQQVKSESEKELYMIVWKKTPCICEQQSNGNFYVFVSESHKACKHFEMKQLEET